MSPTTETSVDAALAAPPPARSPWQRFYGSVHRLRRNWYRRYARRLPRPVVSVGNLHWGGAGKTPLTAALAAFLRDRGLRVAILSRGYKSAGSGVRLVSDWRDGPLLGARAAGDEPVLLAGLLPGVAVVVGPDRHEAGSVALERLDPPPEIFLLDDGFSHLRLARDLDLLAFPAADPFGGGKLPPGGRLREPLVSARWAHAALLTGLDADPESAGQLARGLSLFGFAGQGFAAPTVTHRPRTGEGTELAKGERVFLVTAIARPEQFRRTAEALGYEIAGEKRFPDHFSYPDSALGEIRRAWKESGAPWVLTTSKDRVKLGLLEAPLAELPIASQPEPRFWRWLGLQVDEIRSRAP